MTGDLLHVDDINYKSFARQRDETINLRFIDFISEIDMYMRFLYVRSFSESHVRIFEKDQI